MAYVVPQVLVFQDLQTVPFAALNPLRAHIAGPHAFLIRDSEADERDRGRLGFYDALLPASYDWPNRPAGALVDNSYVKLWMRNALLQYFQDTISQGSTITKTAGANNRVRSATVNFAANGVAFPRSALLLDRDVIPGDVVKVRGLNSLAESVTLWTYVQSLVGDPEAAVVDAAIPDENNADTQVASAVVTKIAGADNCIVATASAVAYDGLTSGFIDETYDVVVTASSVNNDLTTAALRVISGSGTDDQAVVTPSAIGVPTLIGTRGLTFTFTADSSAACSASASADTVSPDDLIAGQRFHVVVNGAFTTPAAASAGTYDGDTNTTYIVAVTRGGLYDSATPPQISVTTTTGVDLSGPTNVTAAALNIDAGTHGVLVSFNLTGLRKGDKYYIPVTSVTEGPKRTIVLAHNLDTDIAGGSEVDVTLYIRKALLQIPQNRTGASPLTNWDVTETQITVNDGITALDETWTASGVLQALPVFSEATKEYGELFVEYRAWLPTFCNEVGAVEDVGEIDLIEGALTPDNPLKWGVFKALENSNGAGVRFTAVCAPDDDDSWAHVLELIFGRDDVYQLVPLTRRRTVLDLYAAHVGNQSSPEQGLWRAAWFNLESMTEIPIVASESAVPGHTAATTSNGVAALAVVEDDPDSAGTQFTILRNTNVNADFLTNKVRAGDIVRILYTGDGFGNYVYQEFVIDEVQAEDQLRLIDGPDASISIPIKFEIWRNLTATEEAAEIALNAGSWGNRRIRATWPDRIESSGTDMEGYFLNCSLAGLCSGVLPHQGLTNLQIVGYSRVPQTLSKFGKAQLDVMAASGVWIVTQNLHNGAIHTRHAVTTGDYNDLNQREEMITRNLDSISFRFKNQFAPFIGVVNVTPIIQARLQLEAEKLITVLKSESGGTGLGGQLIGGQIVEFGPSIVFKDRYLMIINVQLPAPFNNLELHLVI